MQIKNVITSITYYPIPQNVIEKYAIERGLDISAEYSAEVGKSKDYKGILADIYRWLSLAPSAVSENGVSFSFTKDDKNRFAELANELYEEIGENENVKIKYGYIGSNF